MEETSTQTLAEDEPKAVDPETGEEIVEEEPEVDPTGRIVELGPKQYHWGTGRRKAARARVRLRPGSGDFVINGKPMKEYFPRQLDQEAAMGPLVSVGVVGKIDVFVNAEGGGNTGQAGAVRLGISRALLKLYPDSLQRLRDAGVLTRDPRMVERKKYGLRGARRAFQWVKR